MLQRKRFQIVIEARRRAPQPATAVPQMPQTSNCRRFHRAIGTKKNVNCLNSRIRVHCVVLWQRGQVRTDPGPSGFCFVPKPTMKNNTTPA
jgi:hypothetical protein